MKNNVVIIQPVLNARYRIRYMWGTEVVEDTATYIVFGHQPVEMFYTDHSKSHVSVESIIGIMALPTPGVIDTSGVIDLTNSVTV